MVQSIKPTTIAFQILPHWNLKQIIYPVTFWLTAGEPQGLGRFHFSLPLAKRAPPVSLYQNIDPT